MDDPCRKHVPDTGKLDPKQPGTWSAAPGMLDWLELGERARGRGGQQILDLGDQQGMSISSKDSGNLQRISSGQTTVHIFLKQRLAAGEEWKRRGLGLQSVFGLSMFFFFPQTNYTGVALRSQNDRYLGFYKIQGCFIKMKMGEVSQGSLRDKNISESLYQ